MRKDMKKRKRFVLLRDALLQCIEEQNAGTISNYKELAEFIESSDLVESSESINAVVIQKFISRLNAYPAEKDWRIEYCSDELAEQLGLTPYREHIIEVQSDRSLATLQTNNPDFSPGRFERMSGIKIF